MGGIVKGGSGLAGKAGAGAGTEIRIKQPDEKTADWRGFLRAKLSGVSGFGGRLMSFGDDGAGFGCSASDLPTSETLAQIKVTAGLRIAAPAVQEIREAIDNSRQWLLNRQHPDGYWVGELEADTTLESYYIMFLTMLGKKDDPRIPKLAATLLDEQLPSGGWNIYHGGPAEISNSVLTYTALKIAGIPTDDPAMVRARKVIREMGGPIKANTYTKFHLAFFGQYDWKYVPAVPPEIVMIPKISPFHIYDMSSWSRAIFIPLSVIYALKPHCPLPPERGVDELYPEGGREKANLNLPRDPKLLSWRNFFLLTDKALKVAEKFPIGPARRAALKRAEKWMLNRFDKSGGLGAILPAMMNSVIALRCLGYEDDHPAMREGIKELEAFEIEENGMLRIQPCVSPVWDTALSLVALGNSGLPPEHAALRKAAAWLLTRQSRRPGDWQVRCPAPPGGWYFEFRNEFYPDVDDTAMVLMALGRAFAPPAENEAVSAAPPGKSKAQLEAEERGLNWMLAMQNEDGGWASFDRNNDKEFLTKIPFADHNAMIDPSTADITARVLEALAEQKGFGLNHPAVKKALAFLKKHQEADGSWFGRWGVNYLYGTWQVLRGLSKIGEDMTKGYVRKAVEWLKSVQHEDGGWGERADSYDDPSRKGKGPSTASQTAWAIMGLLAAGQGHSAAVRRGIRYLLGTRGDDGTWDEEEFTGTGFPRVFYLRYHLYRHYFPLTALSQYEAYRRSSPRNSERLQAVE